MIEDTDIVIVQIVGYSLIMDQGQRNFSGPSLSRTETANNSDNAKGAIGTKGTSDREGGRGQPDNNRQGSSDLSWGFTSQPGAFAHTSREGEGQSSSGVYNRIIPPTRPRPHGDDASGIIKSVVSFFTVITE